MFYFVNGTDGTVNLQNTLSSSTSDTSLAGTVKGPHHPITCSSGDLYIDEDNTMRCNHSIAPPDNPRNQAILDTTISILILELACQKL